MKRVISLIVAVVLMLSTSLVPALAQMEPSVEVSDQDVTGNTVVVAKVVYDQAGWIVIHKDQDGKPGSIIGWAAIQAGENVNVQVTLQEELMETTTLWAMLHTDVGTIGEFDGDPSVKVNDQTVMAAFTATPAMQEGMQDDQMAGPYIKVSDQTSDGTTVVVDEVNYDQPGLVVIHKEADGKPGPAIGWTALQPGKNTNVEVSLSETVSDGQKLFAMLHSDVGTVGEFDGDPSVKVDDQTVVQAFTVSVAPATLPVTGSDSAIPFWPMVLLAAGGLLVLGGVVYRLRLQE
ncbi:MAG: hypothetical protein Q9O62_01545 [Ardenticatenia bacterium]|nr:hypothetical protein [Ardenticatenia bacterium]